MSAKTEISSLLVTNAAVAEKFCSNLSVYERTVGNVITVDAKCFRCAEVLFAV